MKKTLFFLFTIFTLLPVFSLPGFEPYIKDIPGEYVYYQDKTFVRESYIGFLTFDSSTYEARYYSPADKKSGLPEKEIRIFFTLNPDARHIELTGEKIASNIVQEDTEIINYIHDMIYELGGRRIKAGKIAPDKNTVEGIDFLHTGIRRDEYFPQFGGDVSVIYDFLVPIFNVKLVETNAAESVLFVVTAGRITATDDKSFDSFKGFPQKYSDKKHSYKKNKNTEEKRYTTADGQSITLDGSWSQSMENLWLLGDAALISMGTIPENAMVQSDEGDAVPPFILRQLLLSNSTSYIDWRSICIENYAGHVRGALERSGYTVKSLVFQPSTLNLTRNIKIIAKKDGGHSFFTFTAFENIYRKNTRYFNNIVKSYSN